MNMPDSPDMEQRGKVVEGVVTVEIETNLDLPPDMRGMLNLARTFDDAGYVKLARYLRACGDKLSGRHPGPPLLPIKPLHSPMPAILTADHYGEIRKSPLEEKVGALVLRGAFDDVMAARLGRKYILVEVHDGVPEDAKAAATALPAGDDWK